MNKWDFRRLRLRDSAIIAALPLAVGLPWLWVQHLLFGPFGPVLRLLPRFHLSADALTAVVMAAYCLLFTVTLWIGDRFLHHFLSR